MKVMVELPKEAQGLSEEKIEQRSTELTPKAFSDRLA